MKTSFTRKNITERVTLRVIKKDFFHCEATAAVRLTLKGFFINPVIMVTYIQIYLQTFLLHT